MADCFFCGAFVGEVNGDGGLKGRTVGSKDICEQCLGELKHWLNATIPRSPSMRTTPISEEDDDSGDENTSDENTEDELIEENDPLSSSAKI